MGQHLSNKKVTHLIDKYFVAVTKVNYFTLLLSFLVIT